jgi:hypothetical protein
MGKLFFDVVASLLRGVVVVGIGACAVVLGLWVWGRIPALHGKCARVYTLPSVKVWGWRDIPPTEMMQVKIFRGSTAAFDNKLRSQVDAWADRAWGRVSVISHTRAQDEGRAVVVIFYYDIPQKPLP